MNNIQQLKMLKVPGIESSIERNMVNSNRTKKEQLLQGLQIVFRN